MTSRIADLSKYVFITANAILTKRGVSCKYFIRILKLNIKESNNKIPYYIIKMKELQLFKTTGWSIHDVS